MTSRCVDGMVPNHRGWCSSDVWKLIQQKRLPMPASQALGPSSVARLEFLRSQEVVHLVVCSEAFQWVLEDAHVRYLR